MVSRRKILSRSRDDLNLDQIQQEDEEDVWHQKDKLFKEHIQEVLDKWNQIDDEIWAKVIVFERNRRVAKAYARAPVLTVNGAEDGFDGMRIGLCGFDNPMRDQKTEEFKRQIGQGIKLKMDDAGNILVRRYSRGNVYIKTTGTGGAKDENSIASDILKLPQQALEQDKVVKLFDMKKFQSNINRELRQAYPDRRRLELQCLSAIAFVKSETEILDCPIWVLVINVVAMDMLKSKLPPMQRPVNVKSRPRLPIPDEDPYSIAGNIRLNANGGGNGGGGGSGGVIGTHTNDADSSGYSGGGSSGGSGTSSDGIVNGRESLYHIGPINNGGLKRSEKAPQLPPRDNNDLYSSHSLPTPDYDDEIEMIRSTKPFFRNLSNNKDKDRKKYVTEDPYYCGLSARVPKFDNRKSKVAATNAAGVVNAATSNNNNSATLAPTQQQITSPSSSSASSSTSAGASTITTTAQISSSNISSKKSSNKLSNGVNNVPKRMSIAYLQHPIPYITSAGGGGGGAVGAGGLGGGIYLQQYASQQQLMVPRHHHHHHHHQHAQQHQHKNQHHHQHHLHQQQQQYPQNNYHQQLLWHARSMESGLDYPSEFNANHYGFDRQDYRIAARRAV